MSFAHGTHYALHDTNTTHLIRDLPQEIIDHIMGYFFDKDPLIFTCLARFLDVNHAQAFEIVKRLPQDIQFFTKSTITRKKLDLARGWYTAVTSLEDKITKAVMYVDKRSVNSYLKQIEPIFTNIHKELSKSPQEVKVIQKYTNALSSFIKKLHDNYENTVLPFEKVASRLHVDMRLFFAHPYLDDDDDINNITFFVWTCMALIAPELFLSDPTSKATVCLLITILMSLRVMCLNHTPPNVVLYILYLIVYSMVEYAQPKCAAIDYNIPIIGNISKLVVRYILWLPILVCYIYKVIRNPEQITLEHYIHNGTIIKEVLQRLYTNIQKFSTSLDTKHLAL